MENEILIQVDDISRYFGDHRAISNISFTLQRGQILGFLGPNGAGKSTTMMILCGVIAASSGRVNISGYDIKEDSIKAKSQIGFLPENPPLYLDQTVDEYLAFCARLRRISKHLLSDAIANSKLRCGLDGVGNRPIGNLSKGYQQRVGIAQAIIHTPAVVILDEPTVGLDPIQIVEIRELISELGEDHSVILSSHILSEIQSTCSRVIIINNGELVMDNDLDRLKDNGNTQRFHVALEKPPLPEELEKIEGIISVTNLDKTRFTIEYLKRSNIQQNIATIAAESGWGLYELIPERDSLEEAFIKLTQGDDLVNKPTMDTT